jgi:CRISPR-associated protein Cas1
LKRDGEEVGRAPCEDIGVVLVDQPQVSYSHAALAALAESDAVLVVCGRNHLPVAVLLPLADHSQVVWRINEQLGAGRPLKKQLWKQLVQAKIRGQAANLIPAGSKHPHPGPLPGGEGDAGQRAARSKLLDYARQVRSGDASNLEAQAARVYWQHWLPEEAFRRDADGEGLNSLLNYGYAVVRAAVARALVAAGLMPSLGLKHSNRSNAFCLADDLLEPLRPLVDERARELYRQGCAKLDAEGKAGLLKLLAEDVAMGGESGPLMVCLHRYAASLVKCFQGQAKRLDIPTTVDAAAAIEPEATESREDGLKPVVSRGSLMNEAEE